MAASNCAHVNLQPCCQMPDLCTVVGLCQKCIFIYTNFWPLVSVSQHSGFLRSVIVLVIDGTVAKSYFGSTRVGWKGIQTTGLMNSIVLDSPTVNCI